MLHVQVVHSKLASGRWPRLGSDAHLASRVKAALASWGFESNRRRVSSGAEADHEDEGAHTSASRRYVRYVSRRNRATHITRF